MPRPVKVKASSTRFGWLWPGATGHPGCLSPCCEARLMDSDMETAWLKPRWNSGAYAPVTLSMELDAPAAQMELCPQMNPTSGRVALVIVNEATGERVAHMSEWTDEKWVTIALPSKRTQRLRLEFTASPSWIAVRAVRFRAAAEEAD
jgi:hypothetical protein